MASTAAQKRAIEKAQADAAKALGPYVNLIVDGETYTVLARDLTAVDVRALREQTGYSYNGLVKAAREDCDIDHIAAFMWLAGRIKGDTASYASVAAGVSLTSDWNFGPIDVTVAEGGELPEA